MKPIRNKILAALHLALLGVRAEAGEADLSSTSRHVRDNRCPNSIRHRLSYLQQHTRASLLDTVKLTLGR